MVVGLIDRAEHLWLSSAVETFPNKIRAAGLEVAGFRYPLAHVRFHHHSYFQWRLANLLLP